MIVLQVCFVDIIPQCDRQTETDRPI